MFQHFYSDSWSLMECSIKPPVLAFLKTLYAFRSVVPMQVWMTPPPLHRAKDSNEPDKFEALIVQYFSRNFWRTLRLNKNETIRENGLYRNQNKPSYFCVIFQYH